MKKSIAILLMLTILLLSCSKQIPNQPPKPIEPLGDWRNNHTITNNDSTQHN